MLVTPLRNWVKSFVKYFENLSHVMIVAVYSFTNVFTYFNDYLMCRSTGADVGGLKV